MEWYEDEVRTLESSRDPRPEPGRAVAFYGSSSIRLWDRLADDFPGVGLVNLGFGGSTLAACAHFFERLVVPWRPRALVVYAGDNDLGDGRSPEDVLGSFRDLASRAAAHLGPVPFAFLSIKPSPARWHLRDRIERANAMVRAEIEGREARHYVDLAPAMLGDDGRPRPELFAEDGLHLSPEGYRAWRDVLESHRRAIF